MRICKYKNSLVLSPMVHRHTQTWKQHLLHHSVSLTLNRTHDSGRLGALSVCHVAQEPRVWSAPPAGEQRSDLQLMHCWISATGCAVELDQKTAQSQPLPSEVLKLLTCHIQGALGKVETHTPMHSYSSLMFISLNLRMGKVCETWGLLKCKKKGSRLWPRSFLLCFSKKS